MHTEFSGEPVDNVRLEDREGDGRISQGDLREIVCGNGKQIELAQGRAQWRALL